MPICIKIELDPVTGVKIDTFGSVSLSAEGQFPVILAPDHSVAVLIVTPEYNTVHVTPFPPIP